jgi:FeS assembly protein IscX
MLRFMSVAKSLKWTDVQDIAMALAEAHATVDVRNLRFTDLHRWVTELDGFVDDPQKSNEKILEAIQMAWLDEID